MSKKKKDINNPIWISLFLSLSFFLPPILFPLFLSSFSSSLLSLSLFHCFPLLHLLLYLQMIVQDVEGYFYAVFLFNYIDYIYLSCQLKITNFHLLMALHVNLQTRSIIVAQWVPPTPHFLI